MGTRLHQRQGIDMMGVILDTLGLLEIYVGIAISLTLLTWI